MLFCSVRACLSFRVAISLDNIVDGRRVSHIGIADVVVLLDTHCTWLRLRHQDVCLPGLICDVRSNVMRCLRIVK